MNTSNLHCVFTRFLHFMLELLTCRANFYVQQGSGSIAQYNKDKEPDCG